MAAPMISQIRLDGAERMAGPVQKTASFEPVSGVSFQRMFLGHLFVND